MLQLVLFSLLYMAAVHALAIPRAPSTDITLGQLKQIIGGTTCSATGQFADECRTAAQALPFINKGFSDYNITTVGEKAALLSLMAFESGGFQFNINHNPAPGNPGQGTRNLMIFPFVYQYALDSPGVSAQALTLVPNPNAKSVTSAKQNAVLDLVLGDDLSFASAMWFYTQSGSAKNGCLKTAGMVKGLQAQTEKGWENYITNCVGTTVTAQRRSLYLKTLKVLAA